MRTTTYEELEDFLDMFGNKELDLLTVVGEPGVGKTWVARHVVADAFYLNLHLTPLSAYKLLYLNRYSPIIIDDIDMLLSNSKLVTLMKQAGETMSTKTLQWHSTTSKLGDVPPKFESYSNLCVILNQIPSNGRHRALFDRGLTVHFEPTQDELLRRMHRIVDEYDGNEAKEVLRVIERNMDIAGNANLRTLVKGVQLKRWGTDWKSRLLRIMDIDEKLVTVRLLLDEHDKVKDAAEEYAEITGCTVRDFYNQKAKLKN